MSENVYRFLEHELGLSKAKVNALVENDIGLLSAECTEIMIEEIDKGKVGRDEVRLKAAENAISEIAAIVQSNPKKYAEFYRTSA